jgi:DNA-directed RNA polymerase subunit beta'
MGTITTVGKLLLKHSVPAEYQTFVTTKELDKKSIGTLFAEMAEKHPQHYKDAVSKLTRLGFEISTRMGSTVRLSDLLPPIDKAHEYGILDKEIADIKASKLTAAKEQQQVNQAYGRFSDMIDKKIIDVGITTNKTLAKVVRAGARGSATQYRQTVFAPVVVNDSKGNVLTEFPVRQSFAEGLSLPEYLAHTFGARQGAVATKLAVADAGYFSKQLSRAAMVLKVEEHDCKTEHGIDVPTTDKEVIGCYLARPAGEFNRNNEISAHLLNTLKDKGISKISVRSVITCEASKHFHSGAVCQMCAGKRELGLPPIGDFIGITAGQTLGEPLAQGTLNTKHSSGSAMKKTSTSGFKLINQLANIPDTFKDKAPLSSKDGVVVEIRVAPQGGNYVVVEAADKTKDEYYVPEGLDVKVHLHQHVEAGDVLSEGIINPAEVVKHKGIGEGRRYFAEAMKEAFEGSGIGGINRRNFELIAKSIVDHVRITNNSGIGDYLPNSIVSYHALTKEYTPRADSKKVRVDQALNQYLEVPVLHYTIGTRITRTIINNLQQHNVESITVNSKVPDFEPEMQRLLDIPVHEHDWMHQLYSTNLERRLLTAVNTGAESDIKGPSPIPGLAYGVGFGLGKKACDVEEDQR